MHGMGAGGPVGRWPGELARAALTLGLLLGLIACDVGPTVSIQSALAPVSPVAPTRSATVTREVPPTSAHPAGAAITPSARATGTRPVPATVGTPATPPAIGATYMADFARWPAGETTGLYRAGVDPATGGYHLVAAPDVGSRAIVTPEPLAPADVALDVDIRADSADATGYAGVVLRDGRDGDGWRDIEIGISATGYLVVRALQPDGTILHQRQGARFAAIHAGTATNHLAVTVRGDILTVAVNGVAAGRYPATVAGSGRLGLILIETTGSTDELGATFADLRAAPLDTVAVPTPPPPGRHPGTPVAATPSAPIAPTTFDFARWGIGLTGGTYPVYREYDSTDGSYLLTLTDTSKDYYASRYAPGQPGYADLTLEVDARRIAGSDGAAYGLVARVAPYGPPLIGDAAYVFLVHADGEVSLSLDAPDGERHTLLPSTFVAAVNRGDATNHLRLTCRGDTLTIAVNGTTIGQYPAEVTQQGAFGIAVENAAGGAETTVAFTNLVVAPAP